MKKTLVLTILFATFMTLVAAQDTRSVPPMSLGEKIAVRAVPGSPTIMQKDWNPKALPPAPFFCNANCLLYSGDSDTTSPDNNGLFNFNNAGIPEDGEVYFSFKGTAAATASGIYGNYFTNATGIGVNPTPAEFRVGVSAGNGGQVVCTTTGNAVYAAYGTGNFGLSSINYWVKNLRKGCKLKPKVEYYATVVPQYNDSSSVGYLEDDDTGPNGTAPPHHSCSANGFKATPNNSFFTSTSFAQNFVATNGASGACGGIGCRGFSWGLNSKGAKAKCKST